MNKPERVTFETSDGVRIVGFVWAASDAALELDGGPWALLLHMMPETKESWTPLAEALAALGVNSLAIDLRGHGESVESAAGHLDFRKFAPDEHRASLLDVDAAVAWLVSDRRAERSRVALCGASIGANLAIAYASSDPRLTSVLAISPGLDYRGITTEDRISAMPAATKVRLVASDDDAESLACARQLSAMRPSATLRELHGAGHGTRIFTAAPESLTEAAEWIRKTLR